MAIVEICVTATGALVLIPKFMDVKDNQDKVVVKSEPEVLSQA